MLPAPGQVEAQQRHGLHGEVDIGGQVVAAVIAGVGQREAGIGLRARLVARGVVAGLDLVGLAPVLGAEGESGGSGQPDVEIARDIQGVGPLGGDEGAVVEVGRRGADVVEQVDVGRVGHVHRVGILAVGG